MPVSQLSRAVGRSQLFVIAFGCVVGSGWVVVLGDWLAAAAPGGAVIGFIGGALGMLAICAAYAELTVRIPRAGGEFEFARQVLGPRTAFAVGWFSILFLLSVASFEGIALAWILNTLVPGLEGPTLYRLFDHDVRLSGVVLGVGGAVALGTLHYRGIAGAARLQKAVTAGFALLAGAVIVTGIGLGSVDNLSPLFSPSKPQHWWQGALWIFASAPFFLSGFQSVPQVVEERRAGVDVRYVVYAMYAAVIFGCLFYCGIILATSMSTPWEMLPGKALPAAVAVEPLLPHGALSRLLLLSAALSVLKIWNGITLWSARLLMAQSRAGFLPARLSEVHGQFGSPHFAVLAVTALNICGVILGRGVLLPLLNMTSICGAFTMTLTVLAALKLRSRGDWDARLYHTPGGRPVLIAGLLCSAAMAIYAAIAPLEQHRGLPLEWLLTGVWAILGAIAWRARRPEPA